jgi:hypothetical protein
MHAGTTSTGGAGCSNSGKPSIHHIKVNGTCDYHFERIAGYSNPGIVAVPHRPPPCPSSTFSPEIPFRGRVTEYVLDPLPDQIQIQVYERERERVASKALSNSRGAILLHCQVATITRVRNRHGRVWIGWTVFGKFLRTRISASMSCMMHLQPGPTFSCCTCSSKP